MANFCKQLIVLTNKEFSMNDFLDPQASRMSVYPDSVYPKLVLAIFFNFILQFSHLLIFISSYMIGAVCQC